MRARVALFLGPILFATQIFAIDRWILISGTISNFHADARLFTLSFDSDIQITATFYAPDGSTPQTATVPVPKRQMKILNDATTQLFSTSKLGAILFRTCTNSLYGVSDTSMTGTFSIGNETSPKNGGF